MPLDILSGKARYDGKANELNVGRVSGLAANPVLATVNHGRSLALLLANCGLSHLRAPLTLFAERRHICSEKYGLMI